MNIFLWVLQILLALHTAMGAVWKFSNSEQSLPALSVMPHSVWIALAIIEILCSVFLILPALKKSLAKLVPVAAIVIAAEMLFFSVLHLSHGATDHGPMIYWLVVAVICGFLAFARRKV